MFLSRQFSFEAGHRLSKNKSLCSNIHGHNYKLIVTLKSGFKNSEDMIVDFSEIKKIIKKSIIDLLDHSLILNQTDKKLIDFCKKNKYKTFITFGDPTAESLAELIYYEVNKIFPYGNNISIHSVTLYETDDCWVTYSGVFCG